MKIYLAGKTGQDAIKWKIITPFADDHSFVASDFDMNRDGEIESWNHVPPHTSDPYFEPDWNKDINRSIPDRFIQMIQSCDLLLAILLGESHGSIAEMAYASAIGIRVEAIVPQYQRSHLDWYWFVLAMPYCAVHEVSGDHHAHSVIAALLDEHRLMKGTHSHDSDWSKELKSKKEGKEWWACFNEYLKSPEWYSKREAVLRRSGGVCEGCLSEPAEMVHHQTYEHVGNELLFELIAICRKCHGVAHPGKNFGGFESIGDILPRVMKNYKQR